MIRAIRPNRGVHDLRVDLYRAALRWFVLSFLLAPVAVAFAALPESQPSSTPTPIGNKTQAFWKMFSTAAERLDGVTIATWALVAVTFWMAYRFSSDSRTDLRVRNHLLMDEQFDSSRMIAKRKSLALQLLSNAKHEEINEDLMNLFESLGLLLRRGLVDIDLVFNSFVYYAPRWWKALEPYVREERQIHGADEAIFEEFEMLARRLNRMKAERSRVTVDAVEQQVTSDLQLFLTDESRLEPV